MISNLFLNRSTQRNHSKKLLSFEDYYNMLRPYFQMMAKGNLKPVKTKKSQIRSLASVDNDMYTKIAENQILYSKLLTQKVMENKVLGQKI
tara:strand:- start:2045 stop:2317 length:273 start_codon:yes stop_codon:yes gene_type:complete